MTGHDRRSEGMDDQDIVTLPTWGTGPQQDLRLAHRLAFYEMDKALGESDYESKVRLAVEDLVDACEEYLHRQHKGGGLS
jgi:hypothetical protein